MALQIEKKVAERSWPAENFSRRCQTGYPVESVMLFLTEKQYQVRFGHRPCEAGLCLEQVQFEPHAKPTSGVLLRGSGAGEGSKIKVVHGFLGDLSTLMFDGSAALRPGLAQQTQQRFEQAGASKVTKSLQKALSTAPFLKDIAGMRAAWLKEREKG